MSLEHAHQNVADQLIVTPPPRRPFEPHEVLDFTRQALQAEDRHPMVLPRLLAYYSPKRNLVLDDGEPSTGGNPREFEVLLRVQEPEGRIIGALDVITAAKKLGLVPEMDYRVLELACREGIQRMHTNDASSPTRISWNGSPETLLQSDFSAHFRRILGKHAFPSSRMAVEVLEDKDSLKALGSSRVLTQLHELLELGVQLHADDLPQDASQEVARHLLAMRRKAGRLQVPIGLKIDRKVTEGLREGNEGAIHTFETVFAMAHEQEGPMIVTAEGAEIGSVQEEQTRVAIKGVLSRMDAGHTGQAGTKKRPLVLLQGGWPKPLTHF